MSDRELAARVAEVVMGWRPGYTRWFNPLTDPRASMEVVDRMVGSGGVMSDQLIQHAFDYLWNADPKRGRVSKAQFDDDHQPVGPSLRSQMERRGWVYHEAGDVVADRPPRTSWLERP